MAMTAVSLREGADAPQGGPLGPPTTRVAARTAVGTSLLQNTTPTSSFVVQAAWRPCGKEYQVTRAIVPAEGGGLSRLTKRQASSSRLSSWWSISRRWPPHGATQKVSHCLRGCGPMVWDGWNEAVALYRSAADIFDGIGEGPAAGRVLQKGWSCPPRLGRSWCPLQTWAGRVPQLGGSSTMLQG